jgi:hypothetical protein
MMDTIPVYKLAVSKFALTEKIPVGSPFWKEFNSSFVNRQLPTDMIMQAVYDGYSITTCHKDNWRTTANYLCGQYLGLDFDLGDKTSSLAYLSTDKFILRYAAFMYSTISHKPEAPRTRVIFLLDQPIMQAKNYALAASALLWLYGSADRACRDAARFFYGSKGCEFEYPNQVLPLAVVKKLIEDYQCTGQVEKHKAANKDFHAPASQMEVQEALTRIPPWQISYDEWVEVLMGLHAEFGAGGLSLALSWADGKDGEVERKFKSFDKSGNEAGCVTIATVFGIAKRFGWQKAMVM